MPSQLLHVLFGEDVAALLGGNGLGGFEIDAHRGTFYLGCQGPDIFYHSRHTRPVALEYGVLLHRRNCGIFCENLLDASASSVPGTASAYAQNAYAFGFMTHAVLDRLCHPYIVYKTGKDGIYHPFFERILDALMFKRLRGKDISAWDQGLLAEACEKPPEDLKPAITRALTAAFPERTGKDKNLSLRISNAFTDSGRFYRITDPKSVKEMLQTQQPLSTRFRSVVYPEHIPDDIDFLNLSHKPWFYPYQPSGSATAMAAVTAPQPDCRSFPEIYAEAVQAAVDTLPHIGDGCLSIHDENGKPCAPNCIEPLPLDTVLLKLLK